MKLPKGTLRVMAAGALVALGAAGAAIGVGAQGARHRPLVQFGLMGVARGQVARLSVTNTPIPGLPPGPCRVHVSFVDPSGNPLVSRDGAEASADLSVDPGFSEHLDLDANAHLPSPDAVRLDLRPIATPEAGFPPGPCLPSFEVIDTRTSSTVCVNPGVASATLTGNHNETLVHDRQ